jgi:hypothetical protein
MTRSKNQIEFITWAQGQEAKTRLYMKIIYIFDLDLSINYGFEFWVKNPLIIKALINN